MFYKMLTAITTLTSFSDAQLIKLGPFKTLCGYIAYWHNLINLRDPRMKNVVNHCFLIINLDILSCDQTIDLVITIQ